MKSLFIPSLLSAVALTLWCDAAVAGGIAQLKGFLAETKSAKASFSQVVASKSGKKQESSGSMAFARPGKFRWSYEKPYQQLLVSDGVKLWSYDKDLEQVTIKKLGDALGNTPAAFLAGSGDVEKNFTLSEPGTVDGVDIVDAVPKDKDSTFQRVRIGFVDKLPKMMEVRDNFGQVTTLSFTGFERNPSFAAGTFSFTPPKGVDIVGE
ncbi:MAG TPA: outer membrane lipoprotein chaperone LolA [Rhodocyclaceae bacterium]|nr:outer membrane lipoprotein chaperone LolA [Rhodocyclaceae bacterium]